MKYELPEKITDLLDEAIEKYGYSVGPTEEEVWEAVRESEEFPHFENTFIKIFYSKLIKHLPKEFTYETYINSYDSHIYYVDNNGAHIEIFTLSDIPGVDNYED